MACGAEHPETGERCIAESPRDAHYRHFYGYGSERVEWDNDEFRHPEDRARAEAEVPTVIGRAIARRNGGRKTGQQLGVEASERAFEATKEEWRQHAREMILQVARSQPVFIVDDVWEAGLEDACDPETGKSFRQGLGGVFRRLAKEGLIVATGEHVSTDSDKRHGPPIAVWRSLVHGDPEAGSTRMRNFD